MTRQLIILATNRNRDEFPITVRLPLTENSRAYVNFQLDALRLVLSDQDVTRCRQQLDYLPRTEAALAMADLLYKDGLPWDSACAKAAKITRCVCRPEHDEVCDICVSEVNQ